MWQHLNGLSLTVLNMQILEKSYLLGYVVAIDDENEMILYYYAGLSYSDELISVLKSHFDGWPIILTDNVEKAKQLANNHHISYLIDLFAAEYI